MKLDWLGSGKRCWCIGLACYMLHNAVPFDKLANYSFKSQLVFLQKREDFIFSTLMCMVNVLSAQSLCFWARIRLTLFSQAYTSKRWYFLYPIRIPNLVVHIFISLTKMSSYNSCLSSFPYYTTVCIGQVEACVLASALIDWNFSCQLVGSTCQVVIDLSGKNQITYKY